MIVIEEREEQVTGSFCGFTMSSMNTVLMQCKERQQFPRSGSLHLYRTTFSYYILNSLHVSNETKKVNGVAIFLYACIIYSHSECSFCIPILFIVAILDLFSSVFYLIRYTHPWRFLFLYQDSLTHIVIKPSLNLSFVEC